MTSATPPPPPPAASGGGTGKKFTSNQLLVGLLVAGAIGGGAYLFLSGGDDDGVAVSTSTTAGGTTTAGAVTTTTGAASTTTLAAPTTTAAAPTTTTVAATSPTSPTTTAAVTTTAAPTAELNPNLPTTFVDENLAHGFIPDPWTHSVAAGGSVSVNYLVTTGSTCVGYAAAAPDVQLTWSGGGSLLRFYFLPDTPGDDTVLIINDPANNWWCSDDTYLTSNPTIDFNSPLNGTYDIWVGTYSSGPFIGGDLFITELSGNHPS